jgi:hypothetical protein
MIFLFQATKNWLNKLIMLIGFLFDFDFRFEYLFLHRIKNQIFLK